MFHMEKHSRNTLIIIIIDIIIISQITVTLNGGQGHQNRYQNVE